MERHISIDHMHHLFSFRATSAEVTDGLAHIVPCPVCWELAAEVIASLKTTKNLVPTRRGRPPEWRFRDGRDAIIVLVEIEEQRSIDSLRAQGWWAELKELSPRDQVEKVKSVAAVQKKEVFETIVREAMLVCRKDPFAGEHLAMSAHLLVDHLPEQEFPADVKNGLRLSAITVVANSRRLASNWEGALSAIHNAKALWLRGRVSLEDQAILLSIHGALSCDTGLFEEAFNLFCQASAIYKGLGDTEGLSIVTIQEADALLMTGLPQESLKKAKQALTLFMPDRLKLLAKSIVTESLISLGRLSGAVRSYKATRPLYEQAGDELTLLKAEFLAALLLDALGHARESEKLFRNAIGGVTEMEAYRLSFIWRLALVESVVKRGAVGKAVRLCEEAIDLLQTTEGIHSQMSQVWKNLRAALQAQVLKEYHLAMMRDYLFRHWTAPAAQVPIFTES